MPDNIYKDWIEYQQNNQTYILDPDTRINEVKFDESVFIVDQYPSKGKSRLGYFKVLDSGKVTLLAKQVVMYKGISTGTSAAVFINTAKVHTLC